MPNFPQALPEAVRDSYQGTPSLQPKRFQMEDSQYRIQRQSVAQSFNYSLSWKMTFVQTQIFEAWFEYVIGGGVNYFDITFAGKQIHVKPTTGIPSYTPIGDKWLVKLDVKELQAKPIVPTRTGILPVWPSTMPTFERDGYTIGPVGSVTQSDLEAGNELGRVRFRQRLTQFSGKIYCDQTQRDLLWEFYRDTLINGAAWFIAPFANAKTSDNQRARIVQQPVETPLSGWYSISLSLETVNAPIMSRSEYALHRDFINDYVEADYVVDDYVGYYVD